MSRAADVANARSSYEEGPCALVVRYRDEIAAPKSEPKSGHRWPPYAYAGKARPPLVDLLNAEQTDNTIRLALARAMKDTASAAARSECGAERGVGGGITSSLK